MIKKENIDDNQIKNSKTNNVEKNEEENKNVQQNREEIETKVYLNQEKNEEDVFSELKENEEINIEKIEIDPDKELKKNLMFGLRKVKLTEIYCHLSGKCEKVLIIIGMIGSIGSGIAEPLMALLFGDSINEFVQSSHREFDMERFKDKADEMVTKYLYIGAIMFLAEFLNNCMWNLSSLRMIHHLKERYFALILSQEQEFFDNNNAYEFSTKVGVQIENIELGLGEKLSELIKMISQIIAGLVISFITSYKLTLMMLIVLPFIMVSVMYLVTSMKKSMMLSRKAYEVAGGIAEEILYNIKTVASFANFEYEKNRFGKYATKVYEYTCDIGKKMAISHFGIIFFVNFTYVIAILYSKKLILNKEINKNTNKLFSGGDVMTVILATILAIMSIGFLSPLTKVLQETKTSASDYFTLLERVPKIDLSGDLKPDKGSLKGKIEFKNVTFAYNSDKQRKAVLNNLNLVFESGKKIALVGESGCGKSTIVNLIERLYDYNSGEILLDNIEIKKFDLNYLRTLIGYVQQEPVLFNNSIRDNIIFGREELLKEIGDTDTLIENACKDSFSNEFIMTNSEGLNYKVGVKGSRLSGGQKQRIAIARAILCNPKILILDEATSALDTKSEKQVQKALDLISKRNVTTIIIAHRLSTIENADIIYAIKNGEVIESGTHKELLSKDGYYAALVKSQLVQDEEKKEKDKENSESLSLKDQELGDNKLDIQEGTGIETRSGMNEKNKITITKKIFGLLIYHKFDVIISSLSGLIIGVLNPIQGWVLSKSINCLLGDEQGLRDKGVFWSMMFLIIAACLAGFSMLKIYKFQKIGAVIVLKMRMLIIEKYLQFHMSFYDIDGNSPGALLTKLSLDTTQLDTLILSVIGDLVTVTGVIVAGLTMGLVFCWRLTLIHICFVPFIVVSRIFINRTKRGARQFDKNINIEAGSILSECVINTKTIFSFNFQKSAVKMYLDILKSTTNYFIRDSILKGILADIGIFANYASMACTFYYAYVFIKKGKITFNEMNESMNIIIMLTNGISNNLTGLTYYSKAKKSFESIDETLETKSLIDPRIEINKDKISGENIKGKIEFKNVTFSYPTKKGINVLKDISFIINPGQLAALVGYSGCGKSTIIQLLERFYDIENGEILIDGINIKDYNLLDLRRKIGLVSQEPVLFKRNVYENIKYGKLDSEKEEVFKAAKLASIEKFFNKEEMGTKEDPVSGGEKQRLAIARVFLKNPKILLLDEATSALDKESEKKVQESIYELQKNRTSITIAHRLSTIENSDIIFVLEDGKIIEKGTHEELLKKNGKYSVLYKYSNKLK